VPNAVLPLLRAFAVVGRAAYGGSLGGLVVDLPKPPDTVTVSEILLRFRFGYPSRRLPPARGALPNDEATLKNTRTGRSQDDRTQVARARSVDARDAGDLSSHLALMLTSPTKQLAPSGITVNTVPPGFVASGSAPERGWGL
jgi:hypothetical protein